MKKFMAAALTALLVGNNPLLVFAVENATVNSVRVSADNVYIATDRPVKYKAFTTQTPPRLVLELMDSRLKTLQEIPVNSSTLHRVRTGQFQTTPSSISRVVMDLTQKTAYEITRKGSELIVRFNAHLAPAAVQVKDAPAAAPAKVIQPSAKAPAKPVEMTLEAAPIKPSSAGRSVPAPIRSRSVRPSYRSIMESLPRDPITFDYSEADIREVIDMMAVKANLNIIYGDDVSGTVTISLTKVPFDEAFKTLLSVKGLAAQQVGDNILRIASPNTLVAEQKKAMPQTRVFFLNYTKAADVKAQVEAVSNAENRPAKCITDETNNAVIVTDTQLGLDSIGRLIRSLDRVPKQVLIEAKLVEVVLDSGYDLGVNWGFQSWDSQGRFVGMGNTNNQVTDSLGNKISLPNTAVGGTGVDLAATNIYGGLRLGRIASDYILDLAITAAARKGKAKVLSDPKVATLNNKEANINITSQIPYQTTEVTNTSAGSVATTVVTYVTTGIILKVTPSINSDGRISMKINPSVSQPSATVGVSAPSVDTRSTDTSVIVKNGETIVIGGLIHDSSSDVVYKVPLLGDIPLLGFLFRKKSVSRTRLELLIFVTPKIIED